jgi:membrane protease YdiL (CAAX protease family)
MTYVVVLSLTDTLVLVSLIAFFLSAHNERFSGLLFDGRPIGRELVVGVPMAITSLVLAVAVLATIQQFAPGLHTVERNPLQDLMRTPRDIAIFAVVVVVAGGVREEIQRAFILHRFERWLGGGKVGVVVASVAFGAGHLLQGVDAAIATGILGAYWGIIYLKRRSVVAPVVSHSGFNLLQLAQALAVGR